MTNDAPKRVLAALKEVARYPEYAHKVNWAINDFIRSELMAYGRAWEQTAGPVSERGGSPMEAGEELVGSALAPLLDKIAEVLLSVQADAQALVAEAYEGSGDALVIVPAASAEQEHAIQRCQSAIRALTPADAIAAREARDKQVREQTLREVAVNLKTYAPHLEDGPEHDVGYYHGYQTALHRILALIEKGQDR